MTYYQDVYSFTVLHLFQIHNLMLFGSRCSIPSIVSYPKYLFCCRAKYCVIIFIWEVIDGKAVSQLSKIYDPAISAVILFALLSLVIV